MSNTKMELTLERVTKVAIEPATDMPSGRVLRTLLITLDDGQSVSILLAGADSFSIVIE